MRKKHSTEFMARVALAALQGDRTMAEISSKYEVHVSVITRWRRRAVEGLGEIFKSNLGRGHADDEKEKLVSELYRQIGQLKVENEWLKKKSMLFEC